MTESLFLIDESSTKANMWSGFRCNRAFVILVLLNVIIFQSIVCEYSSSYRISFSSQVTSIRSCLQQREWRVNSAVDGHCVVLARDLKQNRISWISDFSYFIQFK